MLIAARAVLVAVGAGVAFGGGFAAAGASHDGRLASAPDPAAPAPEGNRTPRARRIGVPAPARLPAKVRPASSPAPAPRVLARPRAAVRAATPRAAPAPAAKPTVPKPAAPKPDAGTPFFDAE